MSRSKVDCLESIKKCNIPIMSIIDVGIRDETPELIKSFPEKKHYLFEINPAHNSSIRANYEGLNYELFNFGLGADEAELYRVGYSILRNGVITHTHISNKRIIIDDHALECDPVQIHRFDSLDLSIEPPFLIKVDVDGTDLEVLLGFGSIIHQASVIIIESTYNKISTTLTKIESLGFTLLEIVDIVYYGESLYQCDLVFLRSVLQTKEIRPSIQNFDKSLWDTY